MTNMGHGHMCFALYQIFCIFIAHSSCDLYGTHVLDFSIPSHIDLGKFRLKITFILTTNMKKYLLPVILLSTSFVPGNPKR